MNLCKLSVLSDFNQKWNQSTNFSYTAIYQNYEEIPRNLKKKKNIQMTQHLSLKPGGTWNKNHGKLKKIMLYTFQIQSNIALQYNPYMQSIR